MALNLPLAPSGSNLEGRVIDEIVKERDSISQHDGVLDRNTQRVISTVTLNSRFRNWLQATYSQILVVSDIDSEETYREDSLPPLTYLCTLLIKYISPLPVVQPICFFCQLHMDFKDNMRGSLGMMRSLIGQLALFLSESGSLDLHLVTQDLLHSVSMQDLSALCVLFERLLRAQSTGVVTCMIDGIDSFENALNRDGISQVMTYLNNLVSQMQCAPTGPILKLLITNHVGDFDFARNIPNRIELPICKDALLEGFDSHEFEDFM